MERVCVFCGSSAGEDPRYLQAADDVGRALVDAELGLVYGGARVGLMGRIAETVLEAGGEVIGVIPEALVRREVAHQELTDLRVVDSMHQRKALMHELSDAFLALPGGLGTLEEFLEVLTWSQLGLHRKPCGILDVSDYYAPFIDFLDHGVSEGFIAEQYRKMVLVDDDIHGLLETLAAYDPPAVPRWIDDEDT